MFNTQIPIYRIMILLSLLVNIIVVITIYKKSNFSKDEIIGALIYENIGIIVGAKLYTFIQDYSKYGKFDFLNLGLSSYGGLIGAIIFLIIFSIQFKKSIKDMMFTFIPSIPLMYAIGKLGCFFAGCCYGIEYNGLGSITYRYSLVESHNVNLFPIQIVETIAFTLIFVYLIYKIYKNKFNLQTLGISFISCGFAKICIRLF